jgi:hypothetical protein
MNNRKGAAERALEIQRYIQQQREKQKSFPKNFAELVHSPRESSDGIWWNDVMEARERES